MKKSKDEVAIIKRMRSAHKWSVFLIICALGVVARNWTSGMYVRCFQFPLRNDSGPSGRLCRKESRPALQWNVWKDAQCMYG